MDSASGHGSHEGIPPHVWAEPGRPIVDKRSAARPARRDAMMAHVPNDRGRPER